MGKPKEGEEMRSKVAGVVAMLAVAFAATAAMAQAPSHIKIGATLPITGGFSAEWGPRFLEFMKAWEKVTNEEGGVLVKEYGKKIPVQLVVYDDESVPDKSVELYEKLAAVDKVHLFLGPSTSPISMRSSTVAERLQVPMVLAEANDMAIFSRGFRWVVAVQGTGHPWTQPFFDMIAWSNGKKMTDYRTMAAILSDTPHTKEVGEGAIENAKKLGLQVVGSELVPFRTMDFSAVIAKLKAANPDVVVLILWDVEMKSFVKQAMELGFRPKQIYSRFMGLPLLTTIGGNVAEGMTGSTFTARKMFDAKFTKIFQTIKTDPYELPWSVIKYGAMETVIKGIELAGSLDREKVMKVFWDTKTQIPMIWGTLQFHWDVKTGGKTLGGFGTLYPVVGQFRGGKLQVIWPEKWQDAAFEPGWRPAQ
jgi:branched-chain amino acid transport system substrate-binding protein